MHSRKRGKSRSKKPLNRAKPSWLSYRPEEVEQLVLKLAKEDHPHSRIGMLLRDQYGIPDVQAVTGKRITKILKEHQLLAEIPEDLTSLIRKSIRLKQHLEENRKDMPVRRGLLLTESKIHRLVKYYKNTERLPADWKFDQSKAKLVIG